MSLDKEQLFRTFGEGLLDDRISKAVAKIGLIHPTLIQAKMIPLALQGKDLLARARTGSGKTFAYAIPVLQKLLRAKTTSTAESRSVKAVILVPSKELCHQTLVAFQQLSYYMSDVVTMCELSGQTMSVQKMELKKNPDIVIATPGRLVTLLRAKAVKLSSVETFVVDEADMILSYGYKEDVDKIISAMPGTCQTMLLSATLSSELDKFRRVVLSRPAILKLEDGETDGTLAQFFVEIDKKDKDLLLYALLRLRLIRGRILFFVNNIDACYRLKLLLEQYVIKSAVLNSELPLRSRQSILDQFNKGVFDHLIATDSSLISNQDSSDSEEEDSSSEDEEEEEEEEKKNEKKNKKKVQDEDEYGVARGIDFKNVSTVVNVDFPLNVSSYIHRIGRAARGGSSGTALSLITKGSEQEQDLLKEIQTSQPERSGTVQPQRLPLDVAELEPMRYRVSDVSRAVTRVAVREARLSEIKRELVNSEKLADHFANNPHDAAVLHDEHLRPKSIKAQMGYLPDYLIPAALKGGSGQNKNSSKNKRRKRTNIKRKRESDPLQTFSYSVEQLEKSQSSKKPRAKTIVPQNQAGRSTAGRRKWKEQHEKHLTRKRRRKKKGKKF